MKYFRLTFIRTNLVRCLISFLWFGMMSVACLWAGQERWTSIGPYGVNVQEIQIPTYKPNIIYLGTLNSGIFKSIDNGESWARLPLINIDTYALAIDPIDPDIVYAGTYLGGIYKSTNGGID